MNQSSLFRPLVAAYIIGFGKGLELAPILLGEELENQIEDW